MRRTRAEALVLVNWKGVFYERYLLDEHVTALEGANGAGKTTVMIAAYVVLLPDMTRLRFTNLGESAATGGDKGVYGRLGEHDSPSYSAIVFRLGNGERLLAGVHLERRAEPTVELTPFVVTGLGDDVALQDILLDRQELDSVPDRNRLRELVALNGGRLQTFSKASDYFASLFERGVTPLRLTGGEERTKLNEMLRTSMVGGISRALTGGLREFLLKAETGLADTLKRMRGNLDACRRTRLEVEAAQRMEEEIHGVYEAGQEMFVAAVHATRERAAELHQRFLGAKVELEASEKRERELATALTERKEQHEAAQAALARVESEREEAREALDGVRAAHGTAARIAHREMERLDRAEKAKRTRDARDARRTEWGRARRHRSEAQASVTAASLGLADGQKGLDEQHRRASAFEWASRRLADARRGLPDEDVRAETATRLREDGERRLGRLDEEIVRLDRTLATATRRRSEYDHVARALVTLTGARVEPQDALGTARRALRELRALEWVAAELPELPARIEQARALAEQQRRVRAAAERLATAERPLASARDLQLAFAATDSALEATRQALSSARAAVTGAARDREPAESEVTELERLLPRWREVKAQAAELELAWERALEGRGDVAALQEQLLGERDRVRQQEQDMRSRHDQLATLADQLEHGGGEFSTELLHARDAVGGELLAGYFEDVGVQEAAHLEAELGPLTDALVVADANQAARTLATVTDRPPTVWLVDDATTLTNRLDPDDAERLGDGVLVSAPSGSRLTRLPARPTLGRRARARRVQALRREIAQIDAGLGDLLAEQRRFASSLVAAGSLLAECSLLERSDPEPDLAVARARVKTSAAAERKHKGRVSDLDSQVGKRFGRRESLRSLLGQAHLLDPPDHREVVSALEERQREARAARVRLERATEPMETVEAGLDVLRTPPPTDAELAVCRDELEAGRLTRDRLSGTLGALRYVEANLLALQWSDAPKALAAKQALQPDLEEQLRRAVSAQEHAEAAERAAEEARERAGEAAQRAQAALDQIDAALALDREELSASGVADASDEALAATQRRYDDRQAQASSLDGRERRLSREVVEAKVRHEGQVERVGTLRAARDHEEGQWRPLADRWRRLQDEAEKAGVLRSAMAPGILESTQAAGSPNLYQEARSKGMLLVERLRRSTGGEELAGEIKAWLTKTDQGFGSAYLQAWLDAREWLRQRVPPQIAEVDDPLETLARVRDHLGRLRGRLARQERSLRGQSEDVARNIETQRRKARREVRRLNEELRNVRFGSIHGVQIQVRPVESRERVLRALREGEAQRLLFQSEMPIEEAMAEIFRRHGGGRTGGQRLLDYREYLDLQVEVRRQGSREWEGANPTRMSTGEAIGVGAAIMMVVLTAWERHANLLRPKRSAGTLRLLFLDEANRLSQDNLGVLFELCEALELQLLIAAPEVAQSEGNTTYRLVRRVDEAGREVVLVTGRRTVGRDA